MRNLYAGTLLLALSCEGDTTPQAEPQPAPSIAETGGQPGQLIVSGSETRACDVEIGQRRVISGVETTVVGRYAVFQLPQLTRDNTLSILKQVTQTGVPAPCDNIAPGDSCTVIGELPPIATPLSAGGLSESGDLYVYCGNYEPPIAGSATVWFKHLQ
jgi:hypothetical protein